MTHFDFEVCVSELSSLLWQSLAHQHTAFLFSGCKELFEGLAIDKPGGGMDSHGASL